jgi:hypothetical protein
MEATEKIKQTTLNDLLNDDLASRQLREKSGVLLSISLTSSLKAAPDSRLVPIS